MPKNTEKSEFSAVHGAVVGLEEGPEGERNCETWSVIGVAEETKGATMAESTVAPETA